MKTPVLQPENTSELTESLLQIYGVFVLFPLTCKLRKYGS